MSFRSERLSEVDRLLHDLEQRVTRLNRIASRASAEAPDTAARIGDAIASSLGVIADRFRSGAKVARHEASDIGEDLYKAGNDAMRSIAREVNQRPLMTLAIAVGVGMLAAGLFARRD